MAAHRAVVIGTGFGGAVASCRLAQAGFEVITLERGRRYDGSPPGFPRGQPPEWLWEPGGGLFDVRALSEIQIVQSAGYGGGSLIYANVHLRAPRGVFDGSWPEGYSREALDPYYDLVAYMLDIQPIDRSGKIPPRAERMGRAAAALDRAGQFIHPPLAVNFAPEGQGLRPNKFGVLQGPCTQCGECVIGCEKRAKNTLDFNYLALAVERGAEMRTECEALRIEPRGGGERGYRVIYLDHQAGAERAIEAEMVFVCAGAINSTELLLRSRAAGGGLTRLSRRLGERYSGNGDLLAFAFDTAPPVGASEGPTINTALLYARESAVDGGFFIVEDGGFPRILWPLVQPIKPLPVGFGPLGGAPPAVRSEVAAALRRAADAGMPPPPEGFLDERAMAATSVFLAMGRDRANGRIELLANGELGLTWDVPSNLPLYSVEERLIRDIARALGGTYRENPFWRLLRQPVSVHNLGGCPMGRSEEDGVTDGLGEVFNYPGLFVLDGAILPRAVGVNPAHTIAAVAERNIEQIVRRTLGEPAWTAPERAAAPRYSDPLTPVIAASTPTRPPDTPAVGVTFTEGFSGWWEREGGPRAAVRCALRVTVDDVNRFIADPAHVGIITGKITAFGLTGEGGADVQNGVYNLLVARGAGPERELRYALPFRDKDGALCVLLGTKLVAPGVGLRLWMEATALDVRISLEAEPNAPALGRGALRMGVGDVVSRAASIRAVLAPNPGAGLRAVLDFLAFYAASARDVPRAA